MTPTVRNWGEVQAILENLDLREAGSFEETEVFPDQIPCTKALMRRGRLRRTPIRNVDSLLPCVRTVDTSSMALAIRIDPTTKTGH